MFMSEAGDEGLYAIPADSLAGLKDYSNDPADSFLVMLTYGGNNDHAAVLMDLLIENYHTEQTEGYEMPQESLQNHGTIF